MNNGSSDPSLHTLVQYDICYEWEYSGQVPCNRSQLYSAYFTEDVNPRFAKPPMKFIDGFDKREPISVVK